MLLAYLEGDSGPRSSNYSQFQQYIMTGGDQSGTEKKKKLQHVQQMQRPLSSADPFKKLKGTSTHSFSASPSQLSIHEHQQSNQGTGSQEEDAFRQSIKVAHANKTMNMPIIQRGQQRRLDARLQHMNLNTPLGGGVEKWQRIETDALTIPSETCGEEDALSYLIPSNNNVNLSSYSH